MVGAARSLWEGSEPAAAIISKYIKRGVSVLFFLKIAAGVQKGEPESHIRNVMRSRLGRRGQKVVGSSFGMLAGPRD